jgi:hypothetical protein
MSFVWKWSFEIALALIVLSVAATTYSFAQNRQLSYAPCLAKVVSALKADPAAAVLAKASVAAAPAAEKDCAIAEDVAREANQQITDMLIGDKSLFDRLPHLLREAGMDCQIDKRSITCGCKSSGPFAIANPCATCATLIDLPLPLQRDLSVAVARLPALKKAAFNRPVTYVVRVAYATTLFEREPMEPIVPAEDEGEPSMNEVINTAAQR